MGLFARNKKPELIGPYVPGRDRKATLVEKVSRQDDQITFRPTDLPLRHDGVPFRYLILTH